MKKTKAVKAWRFLIGNVPVWSFHEAGVTCAFCAGVKHTRKCWYRQLEAILRPVPAKRRKPRAKTTHG